MKEGGEKIEKMKKSIFEQGVLLLFGSLNQLVKKIPAHNYAIYSIVSLNNKNTILTSSRDKTIKVWSSDLTFMQRLDFKDGGHKHSVNKIRKLDEDRFVSVSDDKSIIIWRGE